MKISIAVPSLNQGRFLRQCLDSIRAQTHSDFEVLIADGGSRDESLAIIADISRADPRFRWVSRQDYGQADAVNKALEFGQGEICAFLNADDVYLHDRVLATVAREFAAHSDLHVLSGSGWYLNEDGSQRKRVRLRYHPLDGRHLMKRRTAVLQPATFWRREVMDVVQLPNHLQYAFDAWFFYDLWQNGFAWRELPDAFAGYRLHGGNKSLQITPQRTLELAALEDHKYGVGSWRGAYLRAVAATLRSAERAAAGAAIKRGIYLVNNSLSFLSVYRIPGI